MSEKPFWPLFFCISLTVLLRRKLFRVKIRSRAVGHRFRLRAGRAGFLTTVPKTRLVPRHPAPRFQ
jgi:hypothetical protein